MRRVPPARELTDPDNERVLGSLTPEAWRGLSVEAVRSEWYSMDFDPEKLKKLNPLANLVHEARQSSGSIRGEHRKDLKEALIGAPAVAGGISVPVAQAAADVGDGGGARDRRRGL